MEDRAVPAGTGGGSDAGCTVHEGLRRLVQLLPRVTRGLRRHPREPEFRHGGTLGPRHGSALSLVREQDSTVGSLASGLDLTLATVSGLVADLERSGLVERVTDLEDRRRTIVRIPPGHQEVVDRWLEGTTAPLARALGKLSPEERAIFIKALGFLDAELNDRPSPR